MSIFKKAHGKLILAGLLIFSCSLFPSFASADTATIAADELTGGGAVASTANYRLCDSIGQPVAGAFTATGSYRHVAGLWPVMAGEVNGVILRLTPANPSVDPASKFTISIEIADVTNLYAFEIDVAFDPAVFQVTKFMQGDFLSRGGQDPVFWMPPTIDNVRGKVKDIVCSRLTPGVGVNGGGILASIEFQAPANDAQSLIEFIRPEVKLSDPSSRSIPVSVFENSYVEVGLDTEPPVAEAGSDQAVATGAVVHFDGSGSTDNIGVISYVWNFGDGSPEMEGVTVDHIYNQPGVYTVTLAVDDAAGNGPVEDYVVIVAGGVHVLKIGGSDPDYNSIQEGINNASGDYTVYVYPGEYSEDLTIPEGKAGIVIRGQNRLTTIIKGNAVLTKTSATICDLTILYSGGDYISYANGFYNDFKLLADAGITAINSESAVKNCVITPNPDIFTANFGKGIQICNLYGNTDIAPLIDNCEISNADTGIYLYSQAFGGAILGEIKNNTLDSNNYGITLRMHKEKPFIRDNEITGSINGIHITYEDGALLAERMSKIVNNTFLDNIADIWCDELGQAIQMP